MHKSELFLNKPVHAGMTILENSKILLYDSYYNILKNKYGSSKVWANLRRHRQPAFIGSDGGLLQRHEGKHNARRKRLSTKKTSLL